MLTKRGEKIFGLIAGESLGLYSLTAQKKKGKSELLKTIPECWIDALKSKISFQLFVLISFGIVLLLLT